jgi:hypothetical protein
MWKLEVKGFGSIIEDESLGYAAKVEKLAALLRGSEWYRREGEDGELEDLIFDLEVADDDSGDYCLGRIYDLADEQRVWLDPAFG